MFMEKLKIVFQELRQKYENKTTKKNRPAIHWQNISAGLSESYHASYAAGMITIKAHSYLGAIHALQRIEVGIASHHLLDFLGEAAPCYKIRPLWFKQSIKPLESDSQKMHSFCKRILELGYNAVLIENWENDPSLKSFFHQLHGYGLKLIIKPALFNRKEESVSPISNHYRLFIKDFFHVLPQTFDYLFWESSWQHPEFTADPSAETFTLPELVLAEARLIQKHMQDKDLIFYVPAADENAAQQAALWMPSLADDLGKKSILAFSAVAGDPHSSFLPPHPFWEQLRQKLHPSTAALMPILNVGCSKMGEGLWPVLAYDVVDEFRARCRHGFFVGIVSAATQLPGEGGFHECNLWVASQSYWNQQIPVSLLVETWFCAFRSDWNLTIVAPLLEQIRSLSKRLEFLKYLTHEKHRDKISSPECRSFAESILVQLKEIEMQLEKEEKKRWKKIERTTLFEYFTFFAADARRIIRYVMQCFNIAISLTDEESESKESFWTTMDHKSGQGARSSSKVVFLTSPNPGAPGSRMNRIYQENYLL